MNGSVVYGDILSENVKRKPGPHGRNKPQVQGKGMQVSERISPCTFADRWKNVRKWHRGSLTLEAALVLPVFWYGISGFLYFLLLFRLQEDVSQTLADVGRELGLYVYNMDEEETYSGWDIGILKVKQELKGRCTDQAALQLVEGGVDGIRLWGSDIMDEEAKITMMVSYQLKTPWILLGIRPITVVQRQVCRAWVGYNGESGAGNQDKAVYITPYGEKYHQDLDCRYLSLSVRTIPGGQVQSERNADGERFGKCASCCKGEVDSLIYITDYGNRYHESLSCAGLKRTVQMVLLTEVQGRTPCVVCGNREGT